MVSLYFSCGTDCRLRARPADPRPANSVASPSSAVLELAPGSTFKLTHSTQPNPRRSRPAREDDPFSIEDRCNHEEEGLRSRASVSHRGDHPKPTRAWSFCGEQ